MYEIKQEMWGDTELTSVYWEMEGVTPVMIDWFFSNMARGYNLWHPNQHFEFGWFKDQSDGPIGSVHWATEAYSDGVPFKIYLRMERPENLLSEDMKKIIQYDHLLIVGAVAMDDAMMENYQGFDTPAVQNVMHQWKSTDKGVAGISTMFGEALPPLIWAQHSAEETGNWEKFLPTLYTLYRVIDNREINPLYDFSIEGKGADAKYKSI